MTPMTDDVKVIDTQAWSCGLKPSLGGAVLWLRHGGRDILRPAPPGESDVLSTACYPLVPFANRMGRARLRFQEQQVDLMPHPVAIPHALHGLGWQSSWDVVHRAADMILLSHRHQGDLWPWAYRAEQKIQLSRDEAILRLSLTNESHRDMPAGLGLHPFFPKPGNAVFESQVRSVWLTGPDDLPTEKTDIPAAWDWSQGTAIRTAKVDHCFAGWSGQARVNQINMRADTPLIHVFTAPDSNFFCVEPVSHAPNKLPGQPDGMTVLKPGQTQTLTMVLRA